MLEGLADNAFLGVALAHDGKQGRSLGPNESRPNFKSIAYPSFLAEIGGIEIGVDGAIYVNAINYFAETYVAVYKDEEWDIIFSDFIYNSALTKDKNNRLWFINLNGLYYLENDSWEKVTSIQSEDASFIKSLSIDIDNNIIIEIDNECPKVLIWDGSTLNEINFVVGECEDCRYVKHSSFSNGTYYASNRKKGIYSFNETGVNDFMSYSQSQLYQNSILTTLHPEDGSHLIIYHDKIQKIINENWLDIILPKSLENYIEFAYLREDKLHICDSRHIWIYENNTWETFPLPNGFSDEIDFLVIGENNEVWYQSNTNFYQFQNQEWKVFTSSQHGITTSIVKDMIIDPKNGDLWVSSFQGLRQYDGNEWYNYDLSPVNHTFSLAITSEGVYVRKSGLYFLNDGIVDTIPMPPNGYYGPFESEMVFDPQNERLFLSGSNYLAVLENDIWEEYTLSNSGVYNGYSNDLNIDNKNNLWLSGAGGGLGIFNPTGILLSANESINNNDLEFINVYPTLIHEDIISIESEQGGNFSIRVFDINGHILDYDHIFLPANIKTEYQIPNCTNGLYLINISDGYKSTTKRIIKSTF